MSGKPLRQLLDQSAQLKSEGASAPGSKDCALSDAPGTTTYESWEAGKQSSIIDTSGIKNT